MKDVDRDGSRLPAYLSGELITRQAGPMPVVVALNGRIVGWAGSYHLPNPLRFLFREIPTPARRSWWMVIPPQLLQDGSNDVQLYLAEGDPGDVTLQPLRLID